VIQVVEQALALLFQLSGFRCPSISNGSDRSARIPQLSERGDDILGWVLASQVAALIPDELAGLRQFLVGDLRRICGQPLDQFPELLNGHARWAFPGA